MQDLAYRLNQWRHEYYNLNAPTVSDEVYDYHFNELKRLELEADFKLSNSPTRTVGYEVVDGLEKTTHTIPLLSLEKTKQTRDVMKFIGPHQVLMMHKLDGLTVKLEYENGTLIRASTRGNGEEGEVITHNVRTIKNIPAQIAYLERLVVVGEAFITKPTFDKLRETLRDSAGNQYKNARNMAAGSIRCYDSKVCAERGLMFSPFNVLEGMDRDSCKSSKISSLLNLGFAICEYLTLNLNPSEQQITKCIAWLRKIAEDEGIPIDGIVLTYNYIPHALACGRTGHHYKDSIAFKFDDDLYETILQDIEWQPSRTGELSPVAVFDTVTIDGCNVSKASLHNLTVIKDLELRIGCRILVSKRNMIIPHVEDNLDRDGFDESIIPEYCPCCNSYTRIDSDVLRCDNTTCGQQILRKFIHFVGKKAMDIEGLSESTLEKFIAKGWLQNFIDIFHLDQHGTDIQALEGFGAKSWQRLQDSIKRSLNTTFVRFMVAMDIPMIGRTASRELGRHFGNDLNNLEHAISEGFDFTSLEGFGETLNKNIHEWFKATANKQLWEDLKKLVNIENTSTGAVSPSNQFSGKTIVVTGKLEHFTRDSIKTKIENLGATAGSTISRKTDYLIAGAKAGSKLDKAKSLGVTVLSESEFLSMTEGI